MILIKNALLNGKKANVLLDGNTIASVDGNDTSDEVIDASGMALFPGFVNTHTHAAMTLFRGYADDMPLQQWLQEKIWPLEAKLTHDDIYWGSKLACLEMIKTGTTCFNDMYWNAHATAKAADETGLRATISGVFLNMPGDTSNKKKEHERMYGEFKQYPDRIRYALGPHAIYTVPRDDLEWARDFSEKNDVMVHMHVSETKNEVDGCIKEHGQRPVEYLNDIGILSPRFLAAHSVWLNGNEIRLLKDNGVSVSHNPTSNMKLAVGGFLMYQPLHDAGVNVSLGTDGCASNNTLDMLESIKIAAIAQKAFSNSHTAMPANEAFDIMTKNGAKALGINAGMVREGALADLVLVDLKRPELTPSHDLISNIVYAANGSCVDTMIVDGKVLMRNRVVEGENEILEKATDAATSVVERE